MGWLHRLNVDLLTEPPNSKATATTGSIFSGVCLSFIRYVYCGHILWSSWNIDGISDIKNSKCK